MKNAIFKKLFKMVLEYLKEMDWQEQLYNLYVKVARPKLEEWVKSTETKFDDVMLDGLNKIVDTFLKPE